MTPLFLLAEQTRRVLIRVELDQQIPTKEPRVAVVRLNLNVSNEDKASTVAVTLPHRLS